RADFRLAVVLVDHAVDSPALGVRECADAGIVLDLKRLDALHGVVRELVPFARPRQYGAKDGALAVYCRRRSTRSIPSRADALDIAASDIAQRLIEQRCPGEIVVLAALCAFLRAL